MPYKDPLVRSIKQKEYRTNNPQYKLWMSCYQHKKRTKRRYWLDKYKIKKGCIDCGYNEHAVVLQWDHRDIFEKSFEIGSAISSNYNLRKLFSELRKCDIVCANCHVIRTHITNRDNIQLKRFGKEKNEQREMGAVFTE